MNGLRTLEKIKTKLLIPLGKSPKSINIELRINNLEHENIQADTINILNLLL